MPVLTFPKSDLEPVLNGEKICSMREPYQGISNSKAGQTLTMQFGARNAPTTLKTTLKAVERLTAQRVLDWSDSVPDHDPRSTCEDIEQLHELLWQSEDPEDFLMVYLADFLGMDVVEMIDAAKATKKAQRDEVRALMFFWEIPERPQNA